MRLTIPARKRAALMVLILVAGCGDGGTRSAATELPAIQEAVVIQNLPLDGSLDRAQAILLPIRSIELPRDPSTFDHSRLLGDGTLYRLELEDGATLVRFDDVTNPEAGSTRIPLEAPPGEEIRSESGRYYIDTGSPGLSIDRNGRGSVWWEEDGPGGRHIEFRIDNDRAEMIVPGPVPDDPDAPVQRRFDITPLDRELSFRLTTGGVDIPEGAPSVRLGGSGFGVAVARLGRWEPEAFAHIPAMDIPNVDAAEHVPGVLTLTMGSVFGQGQVVQVTYDSHNRSWRDYRRLVEFPEAQGIEVADVGPAGVLVVLGLPWNSTRQDPETGLYWVRPDEPVRHLLQRIRDLRTVTLPDGFVALFQDDHRRDRRAEDPSEMYVLRARGTELALYTFPRPGLCSSSHFVAIGENRFVATFCSHQAVEFKLP